MNRILFENEACVLSQQAPCPRTINVDGLYTRLYFPYIIFAVREAPDQRRFYAFASSKPLRYITDKVSRMPLPNIYSDGRVCLGEYPYWGATIRRFHDWGIHQFFTSIFKERELRNGLWGMEIAESWRRTKTPLEMNWGYGNTWSLKTNEISSINELDDLYHPHIEKRAYQLWEKAGGPIGYDEYFWQQAEQEIVKEFQ